MPAEHGGGGSWQIVGGSGPFANLRGKGTWTSVRLSGSSGDPATITFRSTWAGSVDFDVSPPTVAVTSPAVRKLKRPKGATVTYLLRVRPTPRTRALQVKIDASDPFGNPSTLARTLRLRWAAA